MSADDTQDERVLLGRRVYARNLGMDEHEAEDAMRRRAGSLFVREAYLAAGGPAWHGPGLTYRDRALVVIAALVGQHVTDERLAPYLALARANGIPEDGLDAVMILLSSYVGQPAASSGAAAVLRSRPPGAQWR